MNKRLIKNSDNYYVTSCGKIFRKNKELLKNRSTNGYITVCIKYKDGSRKSRFVHRLVAEEFIPNPENKPVVNHKNLVKSDNSVENLEWNTYQENSRHAHENGAFRVSGYHHNALMTEDKIRACCLMIQEGRRNKDISEATGVCRKIVGQIRNKETWVHISKDYIFPKGRVRLLSDATIHWVCNKIVEGYTPKQIQDMSDGKVKKHHAYDISTKKCYLDISSLYF